jgi:hypothetical protein
MDAQITVTLPEELLRRAELLARRTGRALPDLLTETITLSLQPLGTTTPSEDLHTCPDEQVQAESELEMLPAEDNRLSLLLDRQQEGTLAPAERAELTSLLHKYQCLLLRKAQALQESVRRGLREPLPS